VVLTAAVTAFAMLLLTLVMQLVLATISDRDVDRVLRGRATAAISSVRSEDKGGGLTIAESRQVAGVAVYDDTGNLVAGVPPQGLDETYRRLSTVDHPRTETVGEQQRVRAEPFAVQDGTAGVMVVAEPLGPYEEAERLALIVSLVTGALATALAATGAAWATHRALRPVAVMAETAAEWSEHDLGRRFDLGPPVDEIGALATTLDTLLEKVSSAIRSEQLLTSELAHELLTPLTTIQGMAELLLLRETLSEEVVNDLEEVVAASKRMAATIGALLDLARNTAGKQDVSSCSLVEILDEVRDTQDAGTISVSVDVMDARLGLPHDLATRTIGPVVANALRFARSRVIITARSESGMLAIVVDDDGPGVDEARSDSIFEPGTTTGTGSGAGLGLAIARRIARSVGGNVTMDATASLTRFVILLPRG
jgi:signal transduction histidine kinase